MLLSLTLRNELLMGAEHEMLVGFTFRICSQGERLTLAFNFFLRPLSEGRILTKMIYLSRKFCESQCSDAILPGNSDYMETFPPLKA
jgi:hypothetical protein